MASNAGGSGRGSLAWRTIGWGSAVVLLLLPFVAMQLGGTGVNWSLTDFIVFGVMLGSVGGAFELAVRASGGWAYRGGAALALGATFLVVWANLAVGIVGSEHNPWNQLFFLALLIGLAGACVARFRARGTSAAMLLTAAALMAAFGVAMISRPKRRASIPSSSWPALAYSPCYSSDRPPCSERLRGSAELKLPNVGDRD